MNPARFVFAHRDIARQQQPDGRFRFQRALRERWIAGAEDAIGTHIRVEFLLQRRLDVDLGQDAETFLREFRGDLCHRRIEAEVDGLAEAIRVLHRVLQLKGRRPRDTATEANALV